jgi:hypothetical protein
LVNKQEIPIMQAIHKPTRRVGLLGRNTLVLISAVVFSACAGWGTQESRHPGDVFRSGDNYVRLVPVEAGAPTNSHPFVTSPRELRRLLAGINVVGADTIRKAPVFSKEQLDMIVPPLTTALSKAGPYQDVTFAVTAYPGLFGKYSPKSVTTGRLFVSAGAMNLIFGLMQERFGGSDYEFETPKTTPGIRARRIDLAPWSIDASNAEVHEQRGDWLVFKQSVIPAAAIAPTRPSPETGARPGGETTSPAIDAKAQEIENRLRLLDRLKEKGAITEQEYRERRRAILEQL